MVFIAIILVYVIIYIDVTLRAREAYLEGEKYWRWHHDPQLKKTALEREFKKKTEEIEKKYKKGKIPKDEYERQTEILKFEHERKLQESSIKYAYIWYKTAVELFSPPRSKWVKLAEKKMPIAKDLWKKELTQKGIKFEEYMLE